MRFACNIYLHVSAAICFSMLRSTIFAQKVHRQLSQHDAKIVGISWKILPKSTKLATRTATKRTLDTSQLHLPKKTCYLPQYFRYLAPLGRIWMPFWHRDRAFWHQARKNSVSGGGPRKKRGAQGEICKTCSQLAENHASFGYWNHRFS